MADVLVIGAHPVRTASAGAPPPHTNPPQSCGASGAMLRILEVHGGLRIARARGDAGRRDGVAHRMFRGITPTAAVAHPPVLPRAGAGLQRHPTGGVSAQRPEPSGAGVPGAGR